MVYARIEKRIKELTANNSEKLLKYIDNIDETDNEMSFKKFKQTTLASLEDKGMSFLINKLSTADIKEAYFNSKVVTPKELKKRNAEIEKASKKDKTSREKDLKSNKQKKKVMQTKPIKQKVKRKGIVYVRTTPRKWESNINASLNVIAKYPIRSKKYSDAVTELVGSTGRTRQAVVKKVQRTRQKLKKGGKK